MQTADLPPATHVTVNSRKRQDNTSQRKKSYEALGLGRSPADYYSDRYLVCDLEVIVRDGSFGSAVDSRNGLAIACWFTPSGGIRYHWGSEFDQQELVAAVADADFIVAHNAKYELGWLRRCGVDISQLLVFDTKLAEYVLLGNLAAGDADSGVPRVSTSLDDCCIRRGWTPKDRIVDLYMKHGIPVDRMPARWVLDRCKQDVESTHELFIGQRARLSRSNRLNVLFTRCLLTPVLSLIESEGMHLDAERVYATHAEYSERLAGLEREFSTLTGGINWRSPKQIAAYLYDTLGFEELKGRDGTPKRTPSGGRLANAKILPKLRVTTDSQREFLALKKDIGQVGAALSKSLDYYKEVCDTMGGTFKAILNQTVTATHRLSSSGIRSPEGRTAQFQNQARAFKKLFKARREGWLIGEADGAQLEYRVAAFLGNDPQARKDISNPDWDIHCASAAEMLNKPYEVVKAAYIAGETWAKKARQAAKEETFGPLYGKTQGNLAQQRWYNAFRERYSVLHDTQKGWVLDVLRNRYLTTPWGLRYYWPHVRMSHNGYCNVGNSIFNYPIQALATAEIIPIAIVYFQKHVQEEGLADKIILVNTVHDSVVAEIHPNHVEDFKRLARVSFGRDVYNYLRSVYNIHFDVQLGTGIKIGTHWGEGQEERYEYLHEKA